MVLKSSMLHGVIYDHGVIITLNNANLMVGRWSRLYCSHIK